MEYIIQEYNKYNEQEILALYDSVGWSNYTNNPTMLANAYKHSLRTFGAYAKEELVGIIRVVGDGHSVVLIQDILINPKFQRKGIGTELIKRILDEYREVYQIHLLTDDEERTVRFYKSIGFIMDKDVEVCAFSRFNI